MKFVAIVFVLASSPAAAGEESSEAPLDLTRLIADGPPLTAVEAADLAVAASPTRARASALRQAAQAELAAVRTGLFPRLELAASFIHVDGFEDGTIAAGPTPFTIPVPRNRLGASARLRASLTDIFLGVRAAIDAAEAGVRRRTKEQTSAVSDVRRTAYEAYYALVRARGHLVVARASVANARVQLDQVNASVAAGYLLPADRLAAEARLAERQQSEAIAQANETMANAGLRILMDRPEGAPFGVRLEPVVAPKADPDEAVANRPELAALRAAADAQDAARSVQGTRLWPRLVVHAGADYARPNRYQIPPQDEFTPSWEIGGVLSWVPNEAWEAAHRRAQLENEQEATLRQLTAVERSIRLEVVTQAAQLGAAETRVEAAGSAKAAAAAAYAKRQAALRAGETTTADLFAAEDQLHRARLAHLDASVALRVAATRLKFAMGRVF